MKALPKSSPQTQAKIRRLGYTPQQACSRGVDICIHHEFHHRLFELENGGTLDLIKVWGGEFLASYYGYAYMKARLPRDAQLWEALCAVVREGVKPIKAKSESFEFSRPSENDYAWYQGQVQALVGRSMQEKV